MFLMYAHPIRLFVCLFVDDLAELGEERVKDWHGDNPFHILHCINNSTGSSACGLKIFFSTKRKISTGCFLT